MSLPRDPIFNKIANMPQTIYTHYTMIDVLCHLSSRAIHEPSLYPSKPWRADRLLLLDPSSSSSSSSSSSHCASPKAKPTNDRRSVQFATDENGKILVNVVTFDRPDASCTSDLYWSRNEKHYFRSSGKRTASEQPAQLVDCLETAFSNCARKSQEPLRQDMQAMFKWANGTGRGLEHGASDLLGDEQFLAVQATVRIHRHLRLSMVQCSNQLVEEELAKFSRQRSGPAREFAYKMALCDALVARVHR
jgi:hypothetical protein